VLSALILLALQVVLSRHPALLHNTSQQGGGRVSSCRGWRRPSSKGLPIDLARWETWCRAGRLRIDGRDRLVLSIKSTTAGEDARRATCPVVSSEELPGACSPRWPAADLRCCSGGFRMTRGRSWRAARIKSAGPPHEYVAARPWPPPDRPGRHQNLAIALALRLNRTHSAASDAAVRFAITPRKSLATSA
jgi:hypothetical protein